jgi:hypothetical protein
MIDARKPLPQSCHGRSKISDLCTAGMPQNQSYIRLLFFNHNYLNVVVHLELHSRS